VELVGNFRAKRTLGDWLTEKYKGTFSVKCPECKIPVISNDKFVSCPHCGHGFEYEGKPYVIIWGNSGNGKTFICEYFAEFFGVELYRVTAEDITTKQELNYFLQSLNTTSLDGGDKLFLIDDFHEFSGRLGKSLMRDIQKYAPQSRYPVIFTCLEYPKTDDFSKQALIVYMGKPFKNQMFDYLKKLNTTLSDEELYDIAENSVSFRSAVLTAKTCVKNECLLPYVSNRALYKSINERNLQEPITVRNIRKIFKGISGVDDASISVMKRFADFDFKIKRYKDSFVSYYREVDPFLVNNMVEPIQKVKLDATYKKPKFKKIKPPKKEKKEKPKKEVSNATLDAWF